MKIKIYHADVVATEQEPVAENLHEMETCGEDVVTS